MSWHTSARVLLGLVICLAAVLWDGALPEAANVLLYLAGMTIAWSALQEEERRQMRSVIYSSWQ